MSSKVGLSHRYEYQHYCFILWPPLPQNLILLCFQISPFCCRIRCIFLICLPPDTKALEPSSVWFSRSLGKDLRWIPPLLCPWNWGLSAKQISQSEGFSRGAMRSSSRCQQHFLFTASAPGNAFAEQQAQAVNHCSGGLCWQLLCLCTQRTHSSTKGQAACWWAKPVYTDVALQRKGKRAWIGAGHNEAIYLSAVLCPFPSICCLQRASCTTLWEAILNRLKYLWHSFL